MKDDKNPEEPVESVSEGHRCHEESVSSERGSFEGGRLSVAMRKGSLAKGAFFKRLTGWSLF